ncbi:MAG: type II secretion system F family protein [Propionibacteriaceae bacterium]|nr:type II secretion system F family protein [Propionibacteriaceae bacterium]
MEWLATSAGVLALWCLLGSGARPPYSRLNAAVTAGGGSGSGSDLGAVSSVANGVAVIGGVKPRDYTGWLLGLGALVTFLALPSGGLWVACAAVVAGVARWLLRHAAHQRHRLAARDQVVRGCGVLAGQLAIGELPTTAIKVAATETELLAPVAAAVDVGGDPVTAFRLVASGPGCEALTQLADGWQVCARTGMPLSETVQAVVANVEREVEREATREAELASARTTGRMLAVLPLVGFLMGYAVAADPLAFITGSVFGQFCLFGACCLAGAGLIWTERLSDPRRTVGSSAAGQANAERTGFAPTLELLAAVVRSGAPLRAATATVAAVVSGPVGQRLREIRALTDIGLGDAEAWRSLRDNPLWSEVARQIAHGADSGAGLDLVLRRAASRQRDRVAAELLVQARRVGAKSALPLVTCYLPAFMLVGVLPIIGSLASEYFG